MLETYNDNSALQETCQTVGNAKLERMAIAYRNGAASDELKGVRIADYGCSGGRNSYEPIRTMISALANGGPGISAECILEDLPTNAWDQVMGVTQRLNRAFDGNVQILCAGTSFYDPVCGAGTLDLAYSFVSVHFLSAAPPVGSHVMLHEGTPEERAAGEAQAARDWERLLLLRARELKKGGKMMLTTMSRDDAGYSWQQFSHLVWDSMREARARGTLTGQELEVLCIPACLRSEPELMAPFCSGSELGSLFAVDSLEFARTEVPGEREMPADTLAPHIRRRVEAVWGGMFLTQLRRLGRNPESASNAMREVWDAFEEKLLPDTSRGWLDMRCFYLQVTRR